MDNQETQKLELFIELNSEEAASVNGGCNYVRRYRRSSYRSHRPRRYYTTSYYYPRTTYYRTSYSYGGGYGCW
jgi:hypothetical protein